MSAPVGPLTGYLALVRWDWAREMKRKDTLFSMGMMGLITLFLFSFALPAERDLSGISVRTQHEIFAGLLWVTFLLAATIGIERAFRAEGGLLDGLLLAPLGRPTIYYARVTSTFLFVAMLQAMILLLFLVLFSRSLSWTGLAGLALGAVATDLGFVALGVMLSAMTASLRGGDVLLRILLFPMLIPIFAATVALTTNAFAGEPPGARAIVLILAFDLTFLGAGHILFEHLVKDTGGGA